MTGTDLSHIDGIDMAAMKIISEAGWDMSKWETEDHSFPGYDCLGTTESAGIGSSGKAGCRPTTESPSP